MNKKLFLGLSVVGLSVLVHVLILFSFHTFLGERRIRKTFFAFGCHSKKISHAYFRRLTAPKSRFQRNVCAQKAKNSPKKAVTQVAKAAPKPPPKKVVKKTPQTSIQKNKPKQVKKQVFKPQQPEKKQQAKQETQKEVEKKLVEAKPQAEQLEEEEFLQFAMLGESDPRMIEFQRSIQKEVDRVWRPPLGVPKGTECVARFTVDKNGKIKEFVMQEPSKIVIYNLSIIRVAKSFEFDKCLWGKSFTVNFRQ